MDYCTNINNNMTVSFYEISEDAGSYRGEQLGLCAIRHLVVAFCEFYTINDWYTTIDCYTEGAIHIQEEHKKTLPRMKLHRHPKKPVEHKEHYQYRYKVPPRGWSHGQMPTLEPTDPGTEDEYNVQQIGKPGSTQGNIDRYTERRKATAPQ